MASKKKSARKLKKLAASTANKTRTDPNCCKPERLLDRIKEFRAVEEQEDKKPKLPKKSIKLKPSYFGRKRIPGKTISKPEKRANAGPKKIILKTAHKPVQAKKPAAPAKVPAVSRKLAAAKKMPANISKLPRAGELEIPEIVHETEETQAELRPAGKPAVPVQEPKKGLFGFKKKPRVYVDHDLEMIRPVEKTEFNIVKYPKRERELNMVPTFESEAERALLEKAVNETVREIEKTENPFPAVKGYRELAKPPAPPKMSAQPEPEEKGWFGKKKAPAIEVKKVLPTNGVGAVKGEEKQGLWQRLFSKKTAEHADKKEGQKYAPEEKTEKLENDSWKRHHKWSSASIETEEDEEEEKPEIAEPPEIFRGPEPTGGREWVIRSQLDEFLEAIKEKGSMSANDAAKKFGVGLEVVENWGKILEENKLIEIHYPAMGEPNFSRPGFTDETRNQNLRRRKNARRNS